MEMEQYTAFQQLNGAGRSVDEIADYNGITALALATEDQQTDWLTIYNGDGHASRGRACRACLPMIPTHLGLIDFPSFPIGSTAL